MSRRIALAAAALLASTTAFAADMPRYTPPPIYQPVVEDYGGWYLRGDIGFSNQSVKRLHNVLYSTATSVRAVGMGFDSAPLFGIGIGYGTGWLRADITGEYRGKANFHGLDIVSGAITDEYRASKSEWLLLANIYADLGTWWSMTPFVGAGVGASANRIHSFLDVCTTCPGGGVATGADNVNWSFAWAIHAGLAYQVTRNVTIELAYRYLSLGDAASGDLITFNGINTVNNPMEFKGITSHDIKLGVRFQFSADTPAPLQQPLFSAPAPTYQPPPPPRRYYPPPPPLMRKG